MGEFHRYKVGDIEVTVLPDGFRQGPVNSNYLINASAEDLAKALNFKAEDFSPPVWKALRCQVKPLRKRNGGIRGSGWLPQICASSGDG